MLNILDVACIDPLCNCYFTQQIMAEECKLVGSGSCCDCRDIVGKIMEQVKAESEQWTEMQDMLEQVRLEMQELQSSRDTWQHRALASDISVRSLNSQVSMIMLRHQELKCFMFQVLAILHQLYVVYRFITVSKKILNCKGCDEPR
jgi:hypothetical protein